MKMRPTTYESFSNFEPKIVLGTYATLLNAHGKAKKILFRQQQ